MSRDQEKKTSLLQVRNSKVRQKKKRNSMSIEEIDSICLDNFDPYRATGLWHILATNLNFWKDKLTPTITYSIHDQLTDGRIQLNDLLEYQSKKLCFAYRPSCLEGIDHQLTSKASRFQWRGYGFLKILKHDFAFFYVDHQTSSDRPYQWLAVIFSSNLLFNDGIIFLTRTRRPNASVLNDFVQFVRDHPLLKKKAANMFYTREKFDDEIYYIRDLQIE